jgi:N utilization substance protein B
MTSADPEPVSVPRRLVREVAVQLLYSSSSPEAAADDFPWTLILAQQDAKVIRSRGRAVLHLQQNRPGRAKPFLQSRAESLPLLENYLDTKAPSKAFRQLFSAEDALGDLFDLLRRQIKSSKEPEAIDSTVQRIAEQNTLSRQSLQELANALGDVRDCPQPLQTLAKAIPRLRESCDLLQKLLSPDPPELRELANLHGALSEREILKKEGQALRDLVVQNLTECDSLIAGKLQNFKLERLGRVERAILRLAVTEFHHCPDIPSAVTINEAIEIARRFGDIESASFVNGLLDKLKPIAEVQ